MQVQLEIAAFDRAFRETDLAVAKAQFDRNRIALVLVLAPYVEIAPRRAVGEHLRPVDVRQAPFHFGRTHPCCGKPAYDCAHTGRRNEINGNA